MPQTPSNSNLPVLTKAYFCIDDGPLYEGFHVASRRWNGWATPVFELDVAKEIAKSATTPDYVLSFVERENKFTLTDHQSEDFNDEFAASEFLFEGKVMVAYPIGSGSWCWDDYDQPEDASRDNASPRG